MADGEMTIHQLKEETDRLWEAEPAFRPERLEPDGPWQLCVMPGAGMICWSNGARVGNRMTLHTAKSEICDWIMYVLGRRWASVEQRWVHWSGPATEFVGWEFILRPHPWDAEVGVTAAKDIDRVRALIAAAWKDHEVQAPRRRLSASG